MTTPYISHVEWGTEDPDELETFLSQLFGWQFDRFAPNYRIYLPGAGGISVGILESSRMKAGGTPNVSVRVDDLDATLDQAAELGGEVVVPKTPMGESSYAFIAAPDGNLVGLQQI